MASDDDPEVTSDVELEGMDVDDKEDEEQDNIEEDDDDDGNDGVAPQGEQAGGVLHPPPSLPAVGKILQDEERRDLELARKERMELLAAESNKIQAPATKQEQLDYLMAQSDVFAHFLAGTNGLSTHRDVISVENGHNNDKLTLPIHAPCNSTRVQYLGHWMLTP